jgi:hypothetical protein
MDKFKIQGGGPFTGELPVTGEENSLEKKPTTPDVAKNLRALCTRLLLIQVLPFSSSSHAFCESVNIFVIGSETKHCIGW